VKKTARFLLLIEMKGAGRVKVAFAVWNGRIAPVFDVSRQVIIVEVDAGREVSRSQGMFESDDARQKADCLRRWGVQTLVCGAVSHSYAALLSQSTIKTIAFVAGEIDEIVGAFLGGRLHQRDYRMPGCACRGRRGIGCSGTKGRG